MKSNMALFDVVRLDHFRGFAAYWEVDAAEDTAINGKWRKGPGMELFRAIEKALGPIPLIAEDTGRADRRGVRAAQQRAASRVCSVLIFGFTPDYDNEHLPHNYLPNSIVYTSTHDSQTVCEQIMDICSEPEKQFAYRYLRTSHAEAMGWSAIKCVWASSANIAMTTLQDLLSLGADARMNTPATIGGKNWRWRVRAEALNPTVAALLWRHHKNLYARITHTPDTDRKRTAKTMKMKTAIFDLDGTLLNTLGDLCDSVNCAIVPRGFPAVDEELTRQRVGNGVRRLVERCIPEEKRTEAMIDECLDDFRTAYNERMMNRTQPYDGIVDTAEKAARAGRLDRRHVEQVRLRCKGPRAPLFR